jgi:zinc protease
MVLLLKEIHTAPLISHWLWYRVGSRDEPPGLSGASHWVEHMQFKGTDRFPAGALDRAISRAGGVWNAFTYLDWTAYFETLPANAIDLALELEADRMVSSRFAEEEVDAERTVILSERQGNENEPLFLLGEAVQAAAFQVHPYRHEVIGEVIDLQTMHRADLFQHYRKYYAPNNAILCMAGDFETQEMLNRLRRLYEAYPASTPPDHPNLEEPPLQAETWVEVQGPGEMAYLQVVYHAPCATHPDFLPLAVLDSLLCGPSDLSIFGGGLSNKTSRLYRALVEKELAISVYGGLQATLDPYLYSTTILLQPESKVEAILNALDDQIRRLQDTLPTRDELARAVKQAKALFVYGSESITHQASWLGFAEIVADQAWYTGYLDSLALITPDDIQRVARHYLLQNRRVIGIYQPTGARDGWEDSA